MTKQTKHRQYNLPAAGVENWHEPVNENWELIDADIQEAWDMAQAALDASTDGDVGDGEPELPLGGGGVGHAWNQTHVDTQWLFDADANDDLEVVTVRTLDGSGSGSLEEAVNATHDPTLIVFEVGGVIDNSTSSHDTYIRVEADNTFIAGQTAPYPGITIIRGGPRIQSDNVIMSHISCLPGNDVGSPNQSRAITFDKETNDVLVDHCTAGWATDTNVSFRQNANRHAFINGINAESLNVSDHHESPHGYAVHQRQANFQASFMGCINMHNWKRNPVSKYPESSMNWINVYSFNWGARHYHGTSGGGADLDWIGCVSYDGPDTDSGYPIFKDGTAPTVYYEDNLILNGYHEIGDSVNLVDEPLHLPPGLDEEDIVPASELEGFLVDIAGPRPADRAPVERRMITDFVEKDGEIINSFDAHPDYPDYTPTSRTLDPPGTGVLEWLQHYTNAIEVGDPNPLH